MLSIIIVVFLRIVLFRDIYFAFAIHIPGVSPHTYSYSEDIKLYVSKLTSTKTQIPYEYYTLPYCKPNLTGLQSENLGEILSGDRIENSVYKLEAKVTKTCEVACSIKLNKVGRDAFIRAIDENYHVHWIVDNLPVGMSSINEESLNVFTRGFPVGFHTGLKKNAKHYLNNHIKIIIQYHDDTDEQPQSTMKIVGFRVEPMSFKHPLEDSRKDFAQGQSTLQTCHGKSTLTLDSTNLMSVDKADMIIFTYDVIWEKSNVEWANRWDAYLYANSPNDKIHWFSIINSMMIVLFLTVIIGLILLRALRNDIAQYNDPATIEEAKEESGWKLVHGDVFRPPTTMPMLFAVLIGTGVQLISMLIASLSFSFVGLLSPSNRGSLTTALIMLYVFMGTFAGYFSSKTYKILRCTFWKQNTLATASFFPGIVFSFFFVLNLALWREGSSGAVPFPTFFTLLFLWFCVSTPLVCVGSFFGYKTESPTFPVRTNQIPRSIPPQPWYMNPLITCLVGGVLPFGAASVELYYMMSALWLHQIYIIFGFLSLVLIVLLVTCAEVSILSCYFHLCTEDYRWWWRSFLTSGACTFYMILYAIWYNLTELDMDSSLPIILYFGYMTILSLIFFVVTGSIGFFACFWFTWKIYASIKVD